MLPCPALCCAASQVVGMRRLCPLCLAMPVLTILRKLSSHIELVKAEVGSFFDGNAVRAGLAASAAHCHAALASSDL